MLEDWDHARVFLAVFRAGNLAGAASRLGLDVSTVSRRIDRLEAELGDVHLFDRTRDGTVPTAAAEAILPAAEEMERGVAQFTNLANAIETTAEGVVRLTAPPGVADCFIAPLLAEFHARYPRVLVELDASIGYADLTRREADLALRVSRPKSGDLVAVKLVTLPARPLASPAYAAELGRLDAWTDARWIGYGTELAGIATERWLAAHVGAARVLRTSHFGSQISAAVAGLGVMMASEPFTRVRRLVPITVSRPLQPGWDALPLESLWLVGHRALRTVPRIAALWEFLVEHIPHPETASRLAR